MKIIDRNGKKTTKATKKTKNSTYVPKIDIEKAGVLWRIQEDCGLAGEGKELKIYNSAQ